jgi:hypothetical protein
MLCWENYHNFIRKYVDEMRIKKFLNTYNELRSCYLYYMRSNIKQLMVLWKQFSFTLANVLPYLNINKNRQIIKISEFFMREENGLKWPHSTLLLNSILQFLNLNTKKTARVSVILTTCSNIFCINF